MNCAKKHKQDIFLPPINSNQTVTSKMQGFLFYLLKERGKKKKKKKGALPMSQLMQTFLTVWKLQTTAEQKIVWRCKESISKNDFILLLSRKVGAEKKKHFFLSVLCPQGWKVHTQEHV